MTRIDPTPFDPDAPVVLAMDPEFLDRYRVLLAMVHEYVMREGGLPEMPKEPDIAAGSSDGYWPRADSWGARYRPYDVRGGILRVPVQGLLIGGMDEVYPGYLTGTDYLQKLGQRAQKDDAIRGVAYMIDSPGGHTQGMFEAVEKLKGIGKPSQAFVSHRALSGGYLIASSADVIHLNPSSVTGSVGIMTMHVERSERLKQDGIKVSLIHAGKHKVDGNPFEPLPESVRNDKQKAVDKLYGQFVASVATNRSMSEEDVRETEARVYDAEDSIKVGFADHVEDLERAIGAFSDHVGLNPTVPGARFMSDITDAQKAEFRAEGMKAERARMKAVIDHDSFKGREPSALVMLTTTDLTAEAIAAVLTTLPKIEPAKPAPAPADDGKGGTSANAGAEDTKTQVRNHLAELLKAENGTGAQANGGEDKGAGNAEQTPQEFANGFYASIGIPMPTQKGAASNE